MTDGPRDYWTPDGAFFVCDGEKYGVAPDGQTARQGGSLQCMQFIGRKRRIKSESPAILRSIICRQEAPNGL